MDRIVIRGGATLSGRLPISGAKNAALTLLPCALLTDQPLTLGNLPRLADVDGFGHLLNGMGVSTATAGTSPDAFGRTMTLDARRISSTTAPYDFVRKMRASILVLGPLIARMGEATVSLPGGCAIGNRPIDLHLKALEQLGAEIEITAGYVKATAPDGGLKGGRITFPIVSVGATENALMAASLASGETVIDNAAREPEIVDLCRCLVAMGAEIEGIGTERLVVHGKPRLHGADYQVMPDRIEAGSYACAAAITGGELELVGADVDDMGAILASLRETGLHVARDRRRHPRRRRRQAASADALDRALSRLPDRHAGAVHGDAGARRRRLGADRDDLRESLHARPRAVADGRRHPGPRPHRGGARRRTAVGADVMATDLRASMSLVLAGLAAEGETRVHRVYHLDRGYERLEEKLSAVGAQIEREADS